MSRRSKAARLVDYVPSALPASFETNELDKDCKGSAGKCEGVVMNLCAIVPGANATPIAIDVVVGTRLKLGLISRSVTISSRWLWP